MVAGMSILPWFLCSLASEVLLDDFLQVNGPTTVSVARWAAVWKASTACFVFAPAAPSSVSEKAAIRDHADDRMSSVRRAAPFPLSDRRYLSVNQVSPGSPAAPPPSRGRARSAPRS